MIWAGLDHRLLASKVGSPGMIVALVRLPERWRLDLRGLILVTPIKVLLSEIQSKLQELAGDIPVTLQPLAMTSGPSISTMIV